MGDDRLYMMRALALAERGLGRTSPNPAVGCVIVNGGEIVGEGWHACAGAQHAEAEALEAAGARARGATGYVTLEPCNHHGRTPPCAEALAEAGVAEVVYALADPNPVASGGAAFLGERGVRVRGGVCEAEARETNRAWLHALDAKRPYVIAKFAMSVDGRIATATGDSKWITGEKARASAHALRARVDAILVGADTVIADDPALTARAGGEVVHEPLRVVLDSRGRIPQGAAALDRGGRGALVAVTRNAPAARRDAYREVGADVVEVSANAVGRTDVGAVLDALYERDVRSLLVEGGGAVHGAFFDADLVDEVWAYVAPVIVGGGVSAVAGMGPEKIADAWRLRDVSVEQLGADILLRGYVNRAGGG